ncbi:hypothetical protein KI387_026932, partial [Taxus chinensis]
VLIINHGISSHRYGSGGAESIRSPPITEWVAANLAGSRRLLGSKDDAEKINGASEGKQYSFSSSEGAEKIISHHKKRRSTKRAVSSTSSEKNEG